MMLLALIMIKGWRRYNHMIIIIIIIIIQIIQVFRIRSRSYVRSRQSTGRRLLSSILILYSFSILLLIFSCWVFDLILFSHSTLYFVICPYMSVCVRAYVDVLRVRVVLNHVIQFYIYSYCYFCFYSCFCFSCSCFAKVR